MKTLSNNFEIALAGADLGKRFIPCRPGEKVPLVKWKHFQEVAPTPDQYERWFKDTGNGIALMTDGMVLFDCDDPEKVRLVLEHCGDTPHRIRTPRGEHLGYRRRKGVEVLNRVRIRGKPIDIRTDGGLELWPFSSTTAGGYEFIGNPLVPLSELPVARIGWTRERSRKRREICVTDLDDGVLVRRARAYLATIEGAISGQQGHAKTFRAACILTQRFGLRLDQAWPLFKEWNEQCEPPWSDRELIHKLEDALKSR